MWFQTQKFARYLIVSYVIKNTKKRKFHNVFKTVYKQLYKNGGLKNDDFRRFSQKPNLKKSYLHAIQTNLSCLGAK